MNIEFYGAAACVTGSGHLLRINNKNILLDCGMYQGKDAKERGNETFNFNPKELDYLILSHAHIDHSGRIPLLYKQGFNGEVLCTEPTMDLCRVMLADSGHILESEVEWKNRKRRRQGLKPIEPLYTVETATEAMRLFRSCAYNEWVQLIPGFKFKFHDAGHLLGSAFIEILINENNKEFSLVYTGDLGNKDIPLLKDPEIIKKADYLIMETTYGNRLHETNTSELKNLIDIIKDTFKRGGNVIIPSFSVGRTQELLYTLNTYVEKNILINTPVFIDSPLATESTKIFNKYNNLFDEEANEYLNHGDNPLQFKGLFFTKSPEESAALNKIVKGAIIISASGMCEAGRIKHHLKHNLWRKECSIVFVGFQAEGTLGRAIVDGTKVVKIFGEEIAVNAKIYSLQGLSGHADRDGLMNWLSEITVKPKKVILVHGDKEAQLSFKELIQKKGYSVFVPDPGDSYTIGLDASTKASKAASISVRDKIDALLSSIENPDEMDKDKLMELIKNTINS
ncbi:MAG: MBL fold metallo-hydrolase RNA specificity domain-containing protein [Solirubrobacterales bacterium]